MTRIACLALLAVIPWGVSCSPSAQPADVGDEERVANLRAFAKLYGYIRYFHPSDEASEIDWGRFAVHGAGRVLQVREAGELRHVLDELFVPVAPTLRLFGAREAPPAIAMSPHMANTPWVFWQHRGYGFGSDRRSSKRYASLRCDRPGGCLFEGGPTAGEIVTRSLAAGLWCRFPLALPSHDGRTLGDPRRALAPVLLALAAIDQRALTAEEPRVRVASVAMAWNVFQHFYPYFDVIETNWDAVLTHALTRALTDRTRHEFANTLRWLLAQLQDGHANMWEDVPERLASLPWRLDWIAGQVVVTATNPHSKLLPGDVVETMDGRPAALVLQEKAALISGSTQWRRHQALTQLSQAPHATAAALTIRRRNSTISLRVAREENPYVPADNAYSLQKLARGVWYVNLVQAEWAEVRARLPELAAAPGVIFDLRGYPKPNHELLNHFLRSAITSETWMQAPLIVYPDRERLVGWDKRGWSFEPRTPRIRGKVAFITGPMAISYAESILGFVEHYKLAQIVGQPTAGANGTINPFSLPGGFVVNWSGEKVLKHDGTQHHLIGIRPTVPVERTIAGVRMRRDELLDAALRVVKKR
jgi:C-terminal processing protease CtpA/Prc